MEGSKSVLKMDPESRERVWGGRAKAANQLGSQIQELNGRLERKEKLLEGYEEDLKRLRLEIRIWISDNLVIFA